jgi:uncharacterized damage-inducible protein DinB
MATHIRRLLSHCVWADRRILRTLEADERLSADADLMRTLAHIFAAEHLWVCRIKEATARVSVWPALSFEECAELASEVHADLEAFAATLTPDDLAREVAYVNTAGEAWRSSLDDMLTQVVMHGSYHRGQITKAIRRVGGKPIATDYIVWARTAGAP